MKAQIPRVFCLFSAMPIACSCRRVERHRKMPVPSAGTLTGNSNSPGGNPVPFITSGTPRCRTCRLESSGTGVADDPRTATTGNQRSLFTYPGKTALNRPGNTHNKLLVTPSGKALTLPLPDSAFRPGCYSFCVRPGTALSTCWSHCGIVCSDTLTPTGCVAGLTSILLL